MLRAPWTQIIHFLTRVRRLELRVLVPLLLLVGGTYAFIQIADEVEEGATRKFDQWALEVFRRADDPAIPIGPVWLREMARDVTALGGVAVLALMIAAVSGYLAVVGKRHTMYLVLVASIGGAVLGAVLKQSFDRERPSLVPHLMAVSTSSFPSGHSMLSAVVYLTLGALLAKSAAGRAEKVYLLTIAVVLTTLVGVSRVFLGVHYPTDVLAGWSAGLVWALLCLLVAQHLQRRGLVEPPGNALTNSSAGS